MSSNIRIPKVCEYCKNSFTAQKSSTKYCSLTCAQRNYKKTKRDEKVDKAHKEYTKIQQNKQPKLADSTINLKAYLSVKDTCKMLNASDSTIRKYIKEGKINTIRIGKKHIIKREDIEKMFQL